MILPLIPSFTISQWFPLWPVDGVTTDPGSVNFLQRCSPAASSVVSMVCVLLMQWYDVMSTNAQREMSVAVRTCLWILKSTVDAVPASMTGFGLVLIRHEHLYPEVSVQSYWSSLKLHWTASELSFLNGRRSGLSETNSSAPVTSDRSTF